MSTPGEVLASFSFLTPCGYQSGSCGYCKSESSGSYYATAKKLTADHYQVLVDRGWRRSGDQLYKPDQTRSCCPHYTIRLPAADFKSSRDQRQSLHRFNRFVLGDEYIKETARLHPKTKQEKKKQLNVFDLQETIKEAEYTQLRLPPEPEHKFEVTLESNTSTEEKYQLFEQYQRLVHKEAPSSISRSSFKRFLCASPIPTSTRMHNGKIQQLGSFHQCYRLDGKLIALGVVDLLPHAVSSVYLIYDVEYGKFGFGKLSALREAAFALEKGYEYYYMGYYIQSCAKMRYKNDYRPQYVLDPVTYGWYQLTEDVQRKLERSSLVSLSKDPAVSATNGSPDEITAIESFANEPKITGYTTAVKAANSGLSLLEFGMPGIMSIEEVEDQLNLDEIILKVPQPGGTTGFAPAYALVSWEEDSITDGATSVKGAIAELAAAVGPEVAKNMIVDLTN